MARQPLILPVLAGLALCGCYSAEDLPLYPVTTYFPDDDGGDHGETGGDEFGDEGEEDEGGGGGEGEDDPGLYACGNGVLEGAEQCDEGLANADDAACTTACKPARCGDGLTWAGVEDCDDANGVDGDGCNIDCVSSGKELWTVIEDWSFGEGDVANGVATDRNGNVYVTGTTGSPGEEMLWVAKYSPDGEPQWFRDVPGARALGNAITVDEFSQPIVVGTVWIPASGTDIFVRKYSTDGDSLWTRRYDSGRQSPDAGYGVATDPSGNIYVCGEGEDEFTGQEVFVRKYDPDGWSQWTQIHDEEGADDGCRGIAVGNDGTVAVAGYVEAGGSAEIWVRKYDTQGTDLWTVFHGGEAHAIDRGMSVAVAEDMDIVVAGYDVVDGEGADVWVRRLDADGVEKWTRKYTGPSHGSDEGRGVDFTMDGAVVIGGATWQQFQGFDGLVRKYSPEGDTWWTDTIDWTASEDDVINAVSVDVEGYILVAGGITEESPDAIIRKYAP